MFHGTTRYFKHLYPGKSPILLTEGCNFVRECCKAYWLFDAILSYQYEPVLKDENVQIWELERLRKDLTWQLTCRTSLGEKAIISQPIEYSDFPLDYFRLWIIRGIALLPSEY